MELGCWDAVRAEDAGGAFSLAELCERPKRDDFATFFLFFRI